MSGLFAKGRVIALASIHSLLDQTIDVMSIPALKQHIRDLEDARENMEGQLVEQRGAYRRAGEKADGVQRQIAELTNNARLLKAQGKTDSALTIVSELNKLEASVSTDTANLAALKSTVASFETIVSSLKASEAKTKGDLSRLESLDATARNSERAAAAIKSVAGAMEPGSIDSLTEKIENRAAKASGQLNAAMGSFNAGVNEDLDRAKAEARLAAL